MQLLLHPPVQSWCFHGSPLRGFPFSLCTTYILKYLLCLKSWQFFICLQQCFKCFWTDNPKVWNPFFPPLSEPSPAPPASVTPSSGRWRGAGPGHPAGPLSSQGFLVGGSRAAADPHTPPGRRRQRPYMLPTVGGDLQPGPPEGQLGTLADAEPLTWAGAGPLTWAGAGPRASGAGPHLRCSNAPQIRPRSAAAADADPAAPRAPPAPPPPAGTSGTALGRAEVLASRWSGRTGVASRVRARARARARARRWGGGKGETRTEARPLSGSRLSPKCVRAVWKLEMGGSWRECRGGNRPGGAAGERRRCGAEFPLHLP